MMIADNNSVQISSTSSSTTSNSNCLVCGDSALTRHFGSLACNACAAFFRRSVAGKRTYLCGKQGTCTIIYGSPKRLCRHCRYLKCLEAGMKESEVQSCNSSSSSSNINTSANNSLQTSPIIKNSSLKNIFSELSPSSPKKPKQQQRQQQPIIVSNLLIALDQILAAHFSAKMQYPSLINNYQFFSQLSPITFELWNQIQKEKLEIYLNQMNFPSSKNNNQSSQILSNQQQPQQTQQQQLNLNLNSLWITMAMTQSTIERNGHKERKIIFDNGTYLELNLNGIKNAFNLNLDEIGDGFLIGSLLKAFTSIYDLCCLSVQCNLTFVDLAFALHLAILSTVLRSTPPNNNNNIFQTLNEQLNSLNIEMEIFYKSSGEKLTALRFITNQLSQFTIDFEIIFQALKLRSQKEFI